MTLIKRFQNKTAVSNRSGSLNKEAAARCDRFPVRSPCRSRGRKENNAASLAEKKAEQPIRAAIARRLGHTLLTTSTIESSFSLSIE